MSKLVLVPEGITEAVDAAKEFYELYKRTVVSGCTPMEQLRFVAALKFFESMLAAPAPDVQPAIYPEEARQMGLEEVPYYTHPPTADVAELVEALKEIIEHCPNSWAEIRADVALKIWEGK